MATVRALFMGPWLTVYFPWLVARAPGTGVRAVATRLLLDQTVGAPVTISATFALLAVLQGRPETALPRIREQLLPALAVSAVYWPVFHSFNFTRIPVRHQPLATHFAALFWQGYLSYRANVALTTDGIPTAGAPPAAPPVAAVAAVA